MGRQLIAHCRIFRDSIRSCEGALAALPEAPAWSISRELIADGAKSRLSEALISQPLCTAIQIALVDLLQAAGIQFAVVIGHSSGEIGAAYAAGLLKLKDAIAIAYYRGLVASVAEGPGGEPGSMMAAAMSFDDATTLCSEPRFAGRVSVAASNAPSSVTLSGDLDAMGEIKERLDSKNVQARQLRVDKAYHSHHMLCCVESYRAYLSQLDVQIQKPQSNDQCAWISSVRPGMNLCENIFEHGLEAQYWIDNMVQPVLFSEAVEASTRSSVTPLALALEIGPHPALRGPFRQTMKPLLSSPLPYVTCLERNKDSIESMSEAMGVTWSHLGPSCVDICGWHNTFGLPRTRSMLKDLPTYAWDHEHSYWHESRLSRNYRFQNLRPHSLLGRQRDYSQNEMTWRNIFRLNEMPWVRGHTFQGQVLFPGAGYISLAVGAAKAFVQDRPIKIVEIRDMNIPKALVISETDEIEVVLQLRSKDSLAHMQNDAILETEFTCWSCQDVGILEKTCEGRVLVHLGLAEPRDFPANSISQVELSPISADRFHRAVSEIGLGYQGVFRTLNSISRTWGHCKAAASWAEGDLGDDCSPHPALLDVAFQAGLVTFLSTAENAMGCSYLPVAVKRAIIDPNQSYQDAAGSADIEIEAHMAEFSGKAVEVDLNINTTSNEGSEAHGMQIDGLVFKAIEDAQPSNDRNIFVKTIWDVDTAYGLNAPSLVQDDRNNSPDMVEVYERMALFYMQRLTKIILPEELAVAKWYHHELFRYVNSTLAMVREGGHAILQKEWLDDDYQTIRNLAETYSRDVDIAMLTAVGENLPSVVRAESEMMEHMLDDGLLSKFYHQSKSLATCNRHVAELVRQISHKNPKARILEIGAGTGGTTLEILKTIGQAYSSYTCTDISASFFHGLREKLPKEHLPKVDFKVLNIENSMDEQDFIEGHYDIVIAANVLHATRTLSETVQNARALLRPAGHLIAIEVTGTMLRETGLMGGLEGWWLGVNEGRTMGPGVSAERWDLVLQQNGFSGIDCIVHDHGNAARHSCSVFSSQALDGRHEYMRDPTTAKAVIPVDDIVIIGGKTLPVSKMVHQAEKILYRWNPEITTFDSIEDLSPELVEPGSFIICLADLDRPFFKEPPTTRKLANLQETLGGARNLIWATCGRLVDDPHANMIVGIGRAVAAELPRTHFQFIDFDCEESWDVDLIIKQVLRMSYMFSARNEPGEGIWIHEPEILVKGNQILVPRIMQDHTANEILNSKRRRIVKSTGPSETIDLVVDGNSPLPSLVRGNSIELTDHFATIKVRFSLALHANDEKPCFLCLGQILKSGGFAADAVVIAISEVDSSSLVVHEDSLLAVSGSQVCHVETLVGVGNCLLGNYILSIFPTEGTLLVYGASDIMMDWISTQAAETRRKVLFVLVSTGKSDSSGKIVIHPRASTRNIRKLIPVESSAMLSFSSAGLDDIIPCLPAHCTVHQFDAHRMFRQAGLSAAITAAYQSYKDVTASSTLQLSSSTTAVVNIREAPERLLANRGRLSIAVDWKREGTVSAIMQPLDARNFFSSHKTYFLVGMAGELGQSLCQFMVRGGARHIVLASRSAANNFNWITELHTSGVDIRVVKMDVTDRGQVRETVAMLRRTMPPIGGVANAALVFEAGVFIGFSAEQVARQLKPKVDGTINLDQEFSEDTLDFFLTFGSLATVCGNPGQAMYHAGNMFMSSLVEKRRRRGQAASILNFGLLVDVGYVARMDRADGSNIEGTLRNLLLTPLSEAEFHHVVLQGIVLGHPSSMSGEVIIGMEPYIDDGKAAARPPWVDKAFFSHMIRTPVVLEDPSPIDELSSSSVHHLRQALEKANGVVEVADAVQALLFNKVESMIQIPSASVDANAPLADLGLDSLNGIEIRQWLLNELQVNLPFLTILGREPATSICRSAAQQIVEKRGNKTDASRPDADNNHSRINESVPLLETQSLRKFSEINSETSTPLRPGQSYQNRRSGPDDLPSPPDSQIRDTSSSLGDGNSPTGTMFNEEHHQRGVALSPPISPNSSRSEIKINFPSRARLESGLRYKRTERLSFAQDGIHFLHSFKDDPASFNVTVQYTVKGTLDVDRLARAVERTLSHHEAYRTCFFADSGSAQVMQHFASKLNLDVLTRVDSTLDEAVEHSQLAFDTLAQHEYSLDTGETFQVIVLTHEPEWHTLVFGFHLIASDALSFSIFLRDLNQAYQMKPFASPDPGSYLDYTRQQLDDLSAGVFDPYIAYWKSQLEPVPTPLPLLPIALVKRRPKQRAFSNNIARHELNYDMVQKIRTASRSCGATSMQFYLAAMQVLLARMANIDDVCIGVTVEGRGHSGHYTDSVGHFANILPMRFNVGGEQTFEQLVQRTSYLALSAFDNAQIPFDVLLKELGMERSATHTPLFQTAFNYRVGDLFEKPLGECTMVMDKYLDVQTPYDMTINITHTAAKDHLVECITNGTLYSAMATDIIMEIFTGMLESLTQNQAVQVKDCQLYSEAQVNRSLALGRGPRVQYQWPSTLSERFQQVVADFPDSVAIKDAQTSMTYGQLAHHVGLCMISLRSSIEDGSRPRVAVLCNPSIDIHAAMLAVLHIGAVYIPLDVTLPAARLRAMILASQPNVLVYHDATTEAMEDCCAGHGEIETLNLSAVDKSSSHESNTSRPTLDSETDSFILFTSGSTGVPKGIKLGQKGIMNYASSKSTFLGLGPVKVLQQTSCGFDMSIAQAFNAFANGGTLIVAPLKARGDPNQISQIMLEENVEMTICTPSEYLMLATYAADTLRECTSWNHACSGGEAVSERLVDTLTRLGLPRLSLTDCYGPTEISCATTFRNIPVHSGVEVMLGHSSDRDGEPGSVGKAIPNSSIYILNDDGKTALPVGMPGEICIGGSGIACGYLDAELSREKFVADPYADAQNAIMYKTGDRGLLQPDGSLTFLGRTDGAETVIKLRGLRIDLDEVATAILEAAPTGSLADAMVSVRGEPQFLVAHIVPGRGKLLEKSQLELILRDLPLPRYMIPAMILTLDEMPRTTNGKVDRKAVHCLPLPVKSERVEMRTALNVPEGELRLIWLSVLGEAATAANIQPDSDFFTVGGSSLLLVHLQNALRVQTGVALSLQELYQAPTLRKMAAAMHEERSRVSEDVFDWDAETSIPVDIQEAVGASASQPEPRKVRRRVLLTGATTFLGGEILRHLITSDDIESIHCVAVSDHEREKLSSDGASKVSVYSGSLLSPSLGLSQKETAHLQSTVDQIIHAAVQGHCMNNYTSVRQALYLSTQFLVRLALPRRIPFHLISAPRVVLLSGQTEGAPVSMAAYQPPSNGTQGVTAAKWASERFLENVAASRAELPVVIHRHCALVGERAPADDVMNSVVRFSVLTRKVPSLPGAQGFFDFKDVADVAREIITGQASPSPGAISYYHHSSDVRVPFSEFGRRMESLHGGEFEEVTPLEWLTAAAGVGMQELLVIHLKANMESKKPLVFPYLGV